MIKEIGVYMEKTIFDNYDFPKQLNNMNIEELNRLAQDIRDFLIEKVSKTGGHLASNLGIVELTIALHKVFETPKDKFIWDVGHQSYVHKILTGRANQFDKLRQFGGLSGFPKRKESAHDAYDTGHSTTSLSAAYGISKARDLNSEESNVIAIIGDGSLTGGMAYEALNNIGESRTKMIIILNDNGMSISPNIGSVSNHLVNLRTSKKYRETKIFAKKILRKSKIGKAISNKISSFKKNLKYSLINKGGVLFEELGFKYLGPVNGHDIEQLTEVLNNAKEVDGPVLIHIITEKGRGYEHAALEPNKFHGIGAFDPDTGDLISKPNSPSYSSIVGNKLLDLGSKDNKIFAISAAMTEATGLLPFKVNFPMRFYDVGIAEQHAVTFAAGLATGGIKPFVAIYSSFLQRAYDQIMVDVALQNLPVVFGLDRAGCVGADGETHNGIYDLSYLMTIPNLKIFAPRDATQLEEVLEYAFKLNSPVAIRYPRGASQRYEDGIKFNGKNIRVYDGTDVDIWAVGTMYQNGLKVKEILEDKGYSVGLVNVVNVKEIEDIDKKDKQKPKLYATIEDNVLSGGFGQSFNSKHVNDNIETINFAWPDIFVEQGKVDELQDKYNLSAKKISERIMSTIEGKT